MNKRKMKAQVYEAFCPKCAARVENIQIGSSFYNFAVYQETTSGILVRVDLDAVYYQKLDVQYLLTNVVKSLGLPKNDFHWVEKSEVVSCTRCNAKFNISKARDFRWCCETEIEAYSTPT